MLKRNFLAGAAFTATALLATSVLAADPPMAPVYKEPVPMPPPVVYDWTGFYVGLNAGYTWTSKKSVTFTGTDTGAAGLGTALAAGGIPSSLSVSPNGFIGGLQAGYNWQNGAWVFGVEADINWVDAKDTTSVTITAPGLVPITTTASRQLRWLGTVRARAGATLAPGMLAYLTGGLAVGNHRLTISGFAPAAFPPLAATNTSSKTSAGWTAGGGLEFALFDGVTLKAEYLYYHLGKNTATIAYAYPVGNTSTLTGRTTQAGHILRAGLNWRFSGM